MKAGKIILGILILSTSLALRANSIAPVTKISGRLHSEVLSSGDSVYLVGMMDRLVFTEIDLGACKPDSIGRFEITCRIMHPMRVYIEAGTFKGELVIEPGKKYEILLHQPDEYAVKTPGILTPVPVEFLNADTTELNYLLYDFQERFDRLLDDYQGSISAKDPKILGKIDTLESLFKKKYYEYKSDYLNEHIHFTFGALQEKLTLENRLPVFDKYMRGKKVSPESDDYMDFFHEYFSIISSGFIGSTPVKLLINNRQSFRELMLYFGQKKGLENDTLCEMLVIKSLSEAKQFEDIRLSSVLAVLDSASLQCKSDFNRKSAVRLKAAMQLMQKGYPLPDVTFENMAGEQVSLKDFKGKYLYLNFWTTWCKTCLQELLLLPEQDKTYGSKITFISISVDKDKKTVEAFLKNYPKFKWEFLYCNNYRELKKTMKVMAIPYYCFTDKEGKILNFPALNPAEMETEFYKIKKSK